MTSVKKNKILKLKTSIFDVETNGLLPTLNTIHCLVIKEWETGRRFVFRKNKDENTIAQGLKLLMNSTAVCGHNIINFDLKAIKKVYPKFKVKGEIIDTLVMSRLICSNQKNSDYAFHRKKMLPGNLIGSHSLEAWGYRLGEHKGDYKKVCEEKGIDPWAEWNQDQEDYCIQDVEVNDKLYTLLMEEEYPQEPIDVEHEIHTIMTEQETNGVPFDLEAAESLSKKLQAEVNELKSAATARFGSWYAPAKKKIIAPLWDDPKGINRKKQYELIDEELGEDHSRKIWAAVTWPKKTLNYKDPKRASYTLGAPYCKVTRKEFNPGSRDHIIDRFTTLYDWEPVEFTDKGRPSLTDDVLETLVDVIPMAEDLKEIFFLQKILGYLKTGKNSWISHCEEGKIHGYVNTGGTGTGRASHSFPNLAQVPSVTFADYEDGKVIKKGETLDIPIDQYEVHGNKALLFGREGKYGKECRELFFVPKTHKQLGVDLKGIEFRCLANLTAPFDDGHLIDLVLNGDIHDYNRQAANLPSREIAKTIIYALMYGAGDLKLGTTVEPTWTIPERFKLGRQIRRDLMEGMPGLKTADQMIKREAAKGYVLGLDGRKIHIRKSFAALNFRLQSDGALIAKEWISRIVYMLSDLGFENGWEHEYVMMLWVHDETQIAVRSGLEEKVKDVCLQAALDAGEHYDFHLPTPADAKIGMNWAQTH